MYDWGMLAKTSPVRDVWERRNRLIHTGMFELLPETIRRFCCLAKAIGVFLCLVWADVAASEENEKQHTTEFRLAGLVEDVGFEERVGSLTNILRFLEPSETRVIEIAFFVGEEMVRDNRLTDKALATFGNEPDLLIIDRPIPDAGCSLHAFERFDGTVFQMLVSDTQVVSREELELCLLSVFAFAVTGDTIDTKTLSARGLLTVLVEEY